MSTMRRTATGTVSMAAADATSASQRQATMRGWRARYGLSASSGRNLAARAGAASAVWSAVFN